MNRALKKTLDLLLRIVEWFAFEGWNGDAQRRMRERDGKGK